MTYENKLKKQRGKKTKSQYNEKKKNTKSEKIKNKKVSVAQKRREFRKKDLIFLRLLFP